MLGSLTVENFAPHVGSTFTAKLEGTDHIELQLVEARPVGPATQPLPAGAGRAPFSLIFRGPAHPVLPQRIYALEHASLGRLEIFIVPVSADTEGVRYEAVFA